MELCYKNDNFSYIQTTSIMLYILKECSTMLFSLQNIEYIGFRKVINVRVLSHKTIRYHSRNVLKVNFVIVFHTETLSPKPNIPWYHELYTLNYFST